LSSPAHCSSRQPAAAGGAGAGKMWLPVLVWVAVARGSAKPLGALQGVEWEARQLPSVSGAPHSFSLFYPELPRLATTTKSTASTRRRTTTTTTTTTRSTSTTTLAPRLVSTTEKDVPLIHFNEEANIGGQNYYDFFPQELLEGSPYKIRVIEHEDFIDYEIEFVEMRDEDGGKDDEEEEYQYEYYNEEEAFNPIASPADAGLTSGFGITFMDLLERARQQHKVGTTTARPKENKARGRLQGVAAQGGRSTTSPPKAVLGQVSDKFRPRSRQSTISTNDPTRRTTVITTSSLFTTERTADATNTRETTETEKMGVVKEETTVEPATVSEAGISVSVTEPVMMLYPDLMSPPKSTEIPDLLTGTTPPFLPERPRSGPVTPEVKLTTEIPETSTLTAEEIFTTGTAATTQSVEERATSTQIPSETSTAEQPATITQKLPSTETETSPTATTSRETSTLIFETTNVEKEDETTSYEDKVEATTRNPGWSSPERRPKRIRTDGGDDEQGVGSKDGVIHSGQYHEVNPGQYSEVHPGQYHEQNPGQYHEVNPGQYHEVHPGQVDVESVKVDFQHRSKDRIYNVQASAGDFILGEVGRIDNSGQTLQGVRYTAVEGEVDEARITEILNRYFGARTM